MKTPISVWRNPWHFLAFGFGSGALPYGPGTWGTLVAIPFYLLFANSPWAIYLGILIITFIFGCWLTGKVAHDIGVHDHSGIVWDEMVGFWLTLFLVPVTWYTIVLGFILFRIFDISKPWPISWLDKHVRAGMGIMLDDIIAAVFANIVLQLLLKLFF